MWVSFVGQTWGMMAACICQGVAESLLMRIPPSFGEWVPCLTIDSGLGTGEDLMMLLSTLLHPPAHSTLLSIRK